MVEIATSNEHMAPKIVTTAHMRALEQAAVDRGATWAGLMEQAGAGVAVEAFHVLGGKSDEHALVLVGPGNNGGDGLVAARHLHDGGVHVVLYLWKRAERSDDSVREQCRARDMAAIHAEDDPDGVALRRLLAEADLVIDALLGMGVNRPLADDLAQIVAAVNERPASAQLLAVDLPTGIDADTGAVLGDAVRADLTVATGLPKRGLLHYPGRAYAGTVHLAEIGLQPELLEACMSEHLDRAQARALLPKRPADSHKGTFGKAMIVAGSLPYPGAASLASAAAARAGAGLVTLAVGRTLLGGPGRLPEVTLRPLPEAGPGLLGGDAADEIFKHIEGYTALLVGCGLGHEKETHAFVERLLGIDSPKQRGQIGFRLGSAGTNREPDKRPDLPPTVIDADGLNILSAIDEWWERLPHGNAVLTPHVGEMKRLLKVEKLEPSAGVAEEAAARWGQVVVLKGATTVIASPDGKSFTHDGGNPALATAGTGDVLAGTIAGLLAQGLEPFDAATLGVYLHSAAGALVRDELGDAGALASDLLPKLPLAIKQLKG